MSVQRIERATRMSLAAPRQPWMHDMKVLVNAPSQFWSQSDGSVDGESICGFYVADTRILSSISPAVSGIQPTPISWSALTNNVSSTVFLPRGDEFGGVDPRVRLTVERSISEHGMSERLVLENGLDHTIKVKLSVDVELDMSSMQEIKGGVPSSALRDGLVAVSSDDSGVLAQCRGLQFRLLASNAVNIVNGTTVTLIWDAEVPSKKAMTQNWMVDVRMNSLTVIAARGVHPWKRIKQNSQDSRLNRWTQRSLQDLDGLRMSLPSMPNDQFLAAGAPWFFTLFGRDSLWAAKFMLPLGPELAESTLRVLAHFQATEEDLHTGAEPGKILHELRAEPVLMKGEFKNKVRLPPLYYGTIDATELWIILLGESIKWGMPDSHVAALLNNLELALRWMRDCGDADGDNLLEYMDRTGHGLSNQGWKDSSDSIRWHDGSLAQGPIALCEVQGYAYQAAVAGANILDHFDRSGTAELREWAESLRDRFNDRFWVEDDRGRYPAVALDRDKRPVDSVTSNIGHLLGTGILDTQGANDVVARLMSPELLSGYGIRTLSRDNGGYSPMSYHCGSVWVHDSAICMMGLAAEGYSAEAHVIAQQLIRAAELFNWQVPELYSGDGPERVAVSYPAACHPQAWSAASAIAVLAVETGLEPHC